jgi:RHS repeat-associated protein
MGQLQGYVRSFSLLAIGLFGACSGDGTKHDDDVGVLEAALSSNARILSFEAVGQDWQTTMGSIASSTNRVEGAYALAASHTQSATFTSAALSSLGTVGDNVTIDLYYPQPAPNPNYLGSLNLAFKLPSRSIYYADLGTQQISASNVGQYQRYTFSLTAAQKQALSATYSDLTLEVKLNVPNAQGPWLLDRIQFGQPDEFDAGAPDSGSSGTSDGGPSNGGSSAGGSSSQGGSGASSGSSGSGGSPGGGGSGGSELPPGTDVEFKIVTPKGVNPNQVALGTEWGLRVHDGVRIQTKDLLGYSSVSRAVKTFGPTTPDTWMGTESHVLHLFSNGPVDLRNYAHVHGDLLASAPVQQQTPGFVEGLLSQDADLEPPNVIRWTVRFPNATNGPITVEPDQRYPVASGSYLEPGAYGDVNVKARGKLFLKRGVYTFGQFTIDPLAELHIDNSQGSVFIYTSVWYVFNGSNTVKPVNPDRNNILFGFGSPGSGINGDWKGLLVSNQPVVLASAVASHRGSVFAPSIVVHQHSIFRHDPLDRGDLCEGVDFCNDLCPCPGDDCESDADCGEGLVCGVNNGACFGQKRGKRVCWSPACQDGIDSSECGQPDSVCGENCECVTPCDADDPNSTCPAGEVCQARMGGIVGSRFRDVCLDPSCPSNDPPDCGHPFSLCGDRCICKPDCSSATCDNPSNGCEGECPNVCDDGEEGCTDDVHCKEGSSCVQGKDGIRRCRPEWCDFRKIVPPLCGSPDAPCGEECPVCTPQCENRECGPDPKCGVSCGSCSDGEFCDLAGQCAPRPSEPPVSVPDGDGGERDLEDLPPGPTTPVGALKGQFSVTEQGTPEYTVPIEVPPGRAGMEPALSLRYSASRLNADVGVGWRLEGLSKITRCPRTYALDGYSRPIRNDKEDRFCIDGKRLESVSGTYGGSGTQYRTLIDSFAKVVSYSDPGDGLQLDSWAGIDRVARSAQGPDYFRVWTKDGRILTYGRTLDSLVLGRDGVRYTWLLNRVEDRAGNTIVVTYENTDFNAALPSHLSARFHGVVRPVRIAYTGHGESVGNREVRFFYETRTDPQVGFVQGGVASNSTERLARIVTYVAGSPVKNYRLQYGDGIASQVQKIYECARDDDSICKAPTTFEYQQESGFTFENAAPDLTTAGQLDANGDGIPDFLKTEVEVDGVDVSAGLVAAQIGADVVVTVGSQFLTPAVGVPVSVVWSVVKGPFWGLFAQDPEITITRTMLLGTGNRYDPVDTISDVQGVACSRAPSFFVDYDRDGKDDIVSRCGFSHLFLSRSLGNGHFEQVSAPVAELPAAWIARSAQSYPGSYDTKIPAPAPILYDIDGDALQDIVSCADEYTIELRRRLAPSLGFSAPIKLETLPLPPPLPRSVQPLCSVTRPTYKILDLEGDGTQDLLVRGPDGWAALQYDLSAPGGPLSWRPVAFPDVGQSQHGGGFTPGDGDSLTLGDLNGDGLLDVWNSSGPMAWLNTGNGRFVGRKVTRNGLPSGIKLKRTALLDYDADGRDDIIENYGEGFNRLNYALLPNARISQFSAQEALDLKWLLPGGAFIHGHFQKAGDLDGDGTPDLFGSGGVFYGSGSKNMTLSRVVDGVGNVIRVSYFQEPNTYEADESCRSGTTWPETCLKRMQGIVASHTEGVLTASDEELVERRYTYRYWNARMSVTGHGFLGFDQRRVTEVPTGLPGRTITTHYEPVLRYKADGSGPASLSPPYLYPFAGLPRVVTVDQHVDPFAHSPLQAAPFERRTVVWNDWEVETSASERPYPWLKYRYTDIFDREVPDDPFEPPPPFEENGLFVFNCTLWTESDGYGNVVYSDEACQTAGESRVEQTITWNTITPDPTNWLIANPVQTTVQSWRDDVSKTRGWEYRYDSRGLLESVLRLSYDGPHTELQHKTTFTRNTYGNIEQVLEEVTSSAPSRTTTITYDADQIFPLTVTNALGHVSKLRFDARWGAPVTVADANGIAVQHAYDDLGLLTLSSDPSGTSAYTYSNVLASTDTPAGHIEPRVQVTVERQGLDGSHGGSSVKELDNYGRIVRSRTEGFGGTEVVSEVAYDPLGRVLAQAFPRAVDAATVPTMSFTYDHLGRVVRTDSSDGSFTERHYASVVTLDAMYSHWLSGIHNTSMTAEVARGIDEEGRESVVVTDYRGNIVRSIDGDNIDTAAQTSNYKYGAFNELIEARDNRNLLTAFGYDTYGRLTSHTDPDSGTSTFSYDGYDDLVSSLDPKQQSRSYTYDALGRLTSVVDPEGTSTWIYDQGENALGRLTESLSPARSGGPRQRVRYAYEPPTDSNNRGFLKTLTYVIDDTEYATRFDYDDLGRTEQIHYPALGGSSAAPIVAKYLYDTSGTLMGLDEIGGSVTKPIWRLAEAFEGHLIQRETFGNGAATNYLYHAERRWLEHLDTTLGSEHIQRFDYAHFDNGLLQATTDTRSTESASDTRQYAYDQLNRLASVTRTVGTASPQVTSFGYDELGNITNRGGTSITYRASQPHLIANAGGNSYQHDANGNVRERTGSGIPGSIQTFEYTPFDLPRQIVTGQAGVTRVTRFDYTADEERVVRRDADITRHFAGDLYQRKLDTGSGTTLEEHFRLYAGSRELAEIVRTHSTTVTDRTLYFHTDRLGSVDTLSNDNGENFRQEFDPFGRPIDPPTPELTRSGYTGHQHDDDLGLIDMRGRVYDPLAGRFMTADPVMQAPFSTQGLNRYSYVFNDPINATDPSGFQVAFNPGTFTMGGESVSATPWAVNLGGGGGGGSALGSGGSSAAAGAGSATAGQVASTLGAGAGLASSIAQTVSTGIGFGRPGYSYTAAPASQAPTTASATRSTQHAVGQNQGGVGPSTADEWGPAPDLSNTAGPYAPAPPVANQILSNPEFRVTDTSGTWQTALEVAMIAQGALEAGFQVGVNLLGRFAASRAATGACVGGLCPCFVAGTSVDSDDGGKPIEATKLGDRVGTELEACSAPELAQWRELELVMTVENDGFLDDLELRLLRPEAWIREQGALEGQVISLTLDDLNVTGHARVTRLGTAGHIAPGTRCPVTGWVRHTSRDVIAVELENGETLLVTRHHRLFSAERGDWVHAGDLTPGEALQTKDGLVHTRSVGTESLPAVEVFNLEVFGAHRYFVGERKVLAHNQYAAGAAKAVNLPSWKKIAIDMQHIASGHMRGGSRVSPLKDLFPDHMNARQVERAVREAYRLGEKVGSQGERVLMRGQSAGLTIEMWVNRATKTIETAYPVFK